MQNRNIVNLMIKEDISSPMRPCPTCTNTGTTKVADLNYALFDDLKMSGEMHLVVCDKCQFIFNDTGLKEADFLEYYRLNDHYLAANSAGSGGYSSKDAKRYSRIFHFIQELQPLSTPRIIDFGCGKGGMLHWLDDNTNARPVGIEASKSCRDFVRSALSIRVINSLKEFSGKVDVVVLSHVLEHIFSPRTFLQELKRVFHEDTLCYIEVPRAEAYIFPQLNWHELYFEHINHFSQIGLVSMMKSAGFQVLTKGTEFFYEEDRGTPECQYVVVKKGRNCDIEKERQTVVFKEQNTLPAHTVIPEVLENGKDVSIWGISQYTQLVLGTYPQLLEKIRFLFDGSSAKIGRTIKGVEVLPSSKISIMAADEVLLLPKSPYIDDMMAFLEQKHFMGQIIQF